MNAAVRYAIVVDTSVARSASPGNDPVAAICRETLATLGSEGFLLAMSDPLWDEWDRTVEGRSAGYWNKYMSRYTTEWLKEMFSRQRVVWKNLPDPDPLHNQVMDIARRSYPTDSRAPDEIDRDWVLIATAREADHRIISLNDRERQRFREIALQTPELHTIFWTDPQREDVPAWLREGAPEREELRL